VRNYVEIFFGLVNYQADPNPPNPPLPLVLYFQAPDQEDLNAQIADFIASLTGIYSYVSQVNPLGSRYFLLDKANASLHIAATNAQFWWENPLALQSVESPRGKAWTDNDGNVRRPPPSEGGTGKKDRTKTASNVRISALSYLELLLGTWELGTTSQGRRLGGVLVPARWIDQLIAIIGKLKAGKITSDQALNLLQKIS
jgi:hypothetical protein